MVKIIILVSVLYFTLLSNLLNNQCELYVMQVLSTKKERCIFCSQTLSQVSAQFSLVAQPCLTLCDPMDCSTSGFCVHLHLPELAQTHFH